MFTIVLVLASGLKLLLPVPDSTHYNDQQSCEHTAVDVAHYINRNVPDQDKVVMVKCLRNA